MRTIRLGATALTCVALSVAMALVACKSSKGTGSGEGSDASDDAADADTVDTSLPFGDDSSVYDFDSTTFEDVGTGMGNCEVPAGSYTVTMTPVGDAGGGSGCVPTTSTVAFPLPGSCNPQASGTPPVCAIDFSCISSGTGTTTTTQGYVTLENGNLDGYETVQVTSTMQGMPILSNCSYTTTYGH